MQPCQKTVVQDRRKSKKNTGRTWVQKKILVINNLYPPQELGGYGRLLFDFNNILENRGHQTYVLTSDTSYLGKISSSEPNIDRRLLLYGEWKDGNCTRFMDKSKIEQCVIWNTALVRKVIAAFNPDCCLLGNIDFISDLIIEPILEKRIPIIHHLGNRSPGYTIEQTPQSALYQMVTASRWLAEEIDNQGYPLSNIDVVYPGAQVDAFYRPQVPDRKKLRVAYAGIMLPYKGPQILIEALKKLHDMGIEFICSLAGTTTDENFMTRLKEYVAQTGMHEKIKFLGFLNRKALQALFSSHNVLVFPSIVQEAFGISQVEAMAAGLLVISSGTGGACEVVEDGNSGLLFEPGSHASLTTKLKYLIDNPVAWEKIGRKGQQRAMDKFDIKRSVDQLESKFDEAIENCRGTEIYTHEKLGQSIGPEYISNDQLLTPDGTYQCVKEIMLADVIEETFGAMKLFLEICPNYPMAHNDIGVLYAKRHRSKDAVEHLETAVRLDPQEFLFKMNLADIYFHETTDKKKAIRIYMDLLRSDPKNIEILLRFATICESFGLIHEAMRLYGRIVELDPSNALAVQRTKSSAHES